MVSNLHFDAEGFVRILAGHSSTDNTCIEADIDFIRLKSLIKAGELYTPPPPPHPSPATQINKKKEHFYCVWWEYNGRTAFKWDPRGGGGGG